MNFLERTKTSLLKYRYSFWLEYKDSCKVLTDSASCLTFGCKTSWSLWVYKQLYVQIQMLGVSQKNLSGSRATFWGTDA